MSEPSDDTTYSGTGQRRSPRAARRVFVSGLELMASVGIFEVEKRYVQRIVVSVELDVADDYDGFSMGAPSTRSARSYSWLPPSRAGARRSAPVR